MRAPPIRKTKTVPPPGRPILQRRQAAAAGVQRPAENSRDEVAPASVDRALTTEGRPLEAGLRDDMGARFGWDFSQVRLHHGPAAEQSARDVGARAYTVSNHIVFGAGEYAPATNPGRSLLAHELAHSVQQSHAPPPTARGIELGDGNGPAERQADSMSRAAAAHLPVPAPTRSGPMVMRATRTFSLTFDDGPHSAELGTGTNRTEKVLDTLRDRGIQGGFFVQTAAVTDTGAPFRGSSANGKILIKRMHDEGHKIGIHTGGRADHEDHPVAQKAGRLESELSAAKTFLKDVTGEETTLVRPPHGAVKLPVKGKEKQDVGVLEIYKTLSLTNVLWDMDGDQGMNLGLETLKTRIDAEMAKVKNRGWAPTTPSPSIVVLYHDIQSGTANNLGALIDHIKLTTKKVSGNQDEAAFAAP